MKPSALLLALAAWTGIVAGAAWAQDRVAQPKEKPKDRAATSRAAAIPEPYARMVKVLALDDQQQKSLKELLAARQKAIQDWQTANADKLKAAKAAQEEARTGADEAARKKANEELRVLNAGREQLNTDHHAKIMALLTTEQKVKWYETLALDAVNRDLAKVELTPDQLTSVKAAWVKLSTGVNLDQNKARNEAIRKLSAQVKKDILTDAQREALKQGGKAKPASRPAERSTNKAGKA